MSNQILEKTKAAMAAFDEKKKALLAELQKDFPAMFTELFAEAPNLKSFGWTQFTPYFNDGNSCEFGVNFDYPYINGSNEDYDEESDISIKIYDYKNLETEEDVRINDEVAEKVGYTWYKGKRIGERGLYYDTNYDEAAAKAVDQIKEVLNSIPEDFFKDLFGDHAKITLHADGSIEVEEYEHD
jgi:hypothetical protein